jgi:hypothetical protein
MAIATKSRASKSAKSKSSRYIGKPAGIIQQRVETAGPSRFGIIAVDCAKQRSKWMLCDFFGKVLVKPTTVEHSAGALRAMASHINAVCAEAGISDSIAAVEMTGVYHRPVQAALRNSGIDTRSALSASRLSPKIKRLSKWSLSVTRCGAW